MTASTSRRPRTAPKPAHGEIFTKAWVVHLILDLCGYTADKDLASLRAVEPACGSGAFLGPMVTRLSESARMHGRSLDDLSESIRAYDLQAKNVTLAQETVAKVLAGDGWDPEQAAALAELWVREADYLLHDEHEDGNTDLVVGNPPYIRIEELGSELTAAYRTACPTMTGRADIYVGFIERGLRSLREGGVLGYIVADRWMRNSYGKPLRQMVADGYSVDATIVMHDVDAFETEVSAYPAISVIRRAVQGKPLVADTTAKFSAEAARQVARLAERKTLRPTTTDAYAISRLPHWFPGGEGRATMATNHQRTATPPPANQNPPGRWPLWSTRPQETPLTWHIQVPGTIRAAVAAADLKAHHVPALTALHALLPVPGQATYNPDAQDEVVGRPAVLAAATGVSAATLRDWLTGTGPLTPYAKRQRTFWLPEDECDTDPTDTGERWVIHVTPHAEGAWLAVPAWWLLARTHTTLRNNRPVERRVMRGLLRTPHGWHPGPPGDPGALIGALMVIERSQFGTTVPRIYSYAVPTLATRWGLSEATAYRYLRAAEAAGYLASRRRTGGHGKAAVRTVVITPDQAPGVPLPPGWGQHPAVPSQQGPKV